MLCENQGLLLECGGSLGIEVGGKVSERQLSGRDTLSPGMRSLYLLNSSFHRFGPFSAELQFPRILFFVAPQTVRSAWQCASGFGTSGGGTLSLSYSACRLSPPSCGSCWRRRG